MFRVITEKLDYLKFSARWVPKQLSSVHKARRMEIAHSFLSPHEEEGEEFLDKIISGDETWISFINVETEKALKQWMHPHTEQTEVTPIVSIFSFI